MGIRNAFRLLRGTTTPSPGVSPSATPGVLSPWQPDTLQSVVWSDILDVDLHILTRAEAMKVPAIARARHLVCTTIARMPIAAYRGDDLVPDGKQPSWLARGDGLASAFHRMLWTIDDLLFTGWSLWAVQRGSDKQILRAEHVNRTSWEFDSLGRVTMDNQPVASASVILIPGPHEGILSFGGESIRTSARMETATRNAADNPVPAVELHQVTDTPPTDAEIRDMIDMWAKARRGDNGGVAFTYRSVETKVHGAHVENLLIEGRNAAAVDAARLVGIPASMIDATPAGASLTYSNVEMRNREFVDYGLDAYMAPVSARLSMDDVTPRGSRVAFDLQEFLPAAPLSAGMPTDIGDPTE